jgi:hypothetical protein
VHSALCSCCGTGSGDPQGSNLRAIKLDIEGMEEETLSAFLPGEQRAVYLVGEMHDYPVNAPLVRRQSDDNGWTPVRTIFQEAGP